MKSITLTILAVVILTAAAQAQLPPLSAADSTFLTAFFTDTTGGRVPPDPNAPITERVFREFWMRVVNGLTALDGRFMWVPGINRRDGKPTAIQSIIAQMDSIKATIPAAADLTTITKRLTADSTRLADDSTRINNVELAVGELTEHMVGTIDLLDSTLSVQQDAVRATLERNRGKREAALRAVLVNADELRQRAQARKQRLEALMQ
ncbi:MAG: hypothetical protein WC659_05290 [Patescibacteria group bacterium]